MKVQGIGVKYGYFEMKWKKRTSLFSPTFIMAAFFNQESTG
jgi:hypothetical protein